MKLKKRILAGGCAFAMLLGTAGVIPEVFDKLSVPINAAAETLGDFEYSVLDDGTVAVLEYKGSETESLVIPDTIAGKKVTCVGRYEGNGSNPPTGGGSGGNLKGFDNVKQIIIPEGVTMLANAVFSGCQNLESVKLPTTLKRIGWYVFSGCPKLESLSICDGLEEIGMGAFGGDCGIKNLVIPASVRKIENASITFAGTGLENIVVSSENEYYFAENGVLYSKDKKTLLRVPSRKTACSISTGTETIADNAFVLCSELTSITVPESIKSISAYTFYSCTSLESISLPNSITSIGFGAFFNCSGLKQVIIPSSVTEIGRDAFGYFYDENYNKLKVDGFTITGYAGSAAETYATENGFTFVALNGEIEPESPFIFEELDDGTLCVVGYNGTQGDVIIPSTYNGKTVTAIGDFPFYMIENAGKVYIPETVRTYGEWALEPFPEIEVSENNPYFASYEGALFTKDLSKLLYTSSKATSVSIPSETSDIDFIFRNGNGNDTRIYVSQNNEYFSSDGIMLYNKDKTELLRCIKSAENVVIPDTVVSIREYSFSGNRSLKSINIPDSVEYIGKNAFYCDYGLESVTIGKGLKSIGESAFEDCIKLRNVTFKGASENAVIGKKAFYDCWQIESLTLPDGIKSIEEQAFLGCIFIKSVTVTESVEDIGDKALGFYYDDEGETQFLTKYDLTISGYKGTEAESYANENGFTFVALDAPVQTDLSSCKATLSYSAYTYTGKTIDLAKYVTVKDGSKVLVNGTDYELSYKNNTKVGYNTATVTITGKGNYTGSVSKKFTIKPAKLAAPTLTTGKGITVSWKADSSAVGYQVQYCKDSSFTKDVHSTTVVGKTTVNLTSIPKPGETWYVKVRAFISSDGTTSGTRYGNYSSAKSITLKKALKSVSIEYSSYTYTGSAIKPKIVSVKDSDGNKLTTSDYSVSYSNNTKVGTATMTVTGKGKFQGTLTKTFVIKPKPGTLTLTTTKGAFKASWPKNTSASGYEIQYSKDKTFKTGVTTYNVSKNTTTSVNFSSKPNSGETWYVKYRAYVTVNGTKYGNYSSVKSIKVK